MSPSKIKRVLAFVGDSIPRAARKTPSNAEGGSKKAHSYRPLPTRFLRDGFDYRQITREGDAAIYEQTWSGCADASACYEVIRIRRRAGFVMDGRFVRPAEVYAPSKLWGADGFTFTNRDKASCKLFEISALKEV